MKDYRNILEKILKDHPEIAAIHVEYKRIDRITIGKVEDPAVIGPNVMFPTQNPIQPLIPSASPELISKLRGEASTEVISLKPSVPTNNTEEVK